jgi:Mn-dependent DtxR family transcriptional regulator
MSITESEKTLLRAIRDLGETATVDAVAKRLSLSPAAVTKTLDSLAERGYLEKQNRPPAEGGGAG